MGFLIDCDMDPAIATSLNLDLANAVLNGMRAWRMVTIAEGDYEIVYEWNKYWMMVARVLQGLIFGNARLSILHNGCVVFVYEWNKYWMLAVRVHQGLIFGNARLSILLNGCVVFVDRHVLTYFNETSQSTTNVHTMTERGATQK